mgnify:CR=1 FL=1
MYKLHPLWLKPVLMQAFKYLSQSERLVYHIKASAGFKGILCRRHHLIQCHMYLMSRYVLRGIRILQTMASLYVRRIRSHYVKRGLLVVTRDLLYISVIYSY